MSAVAETAGISAAYLHCEQITRTQARNFSYGIRLLPSDKRRALSAVYAFARRIDDVGDGELPAEQKLAALAQARAEVAELAGSGKAPDGDLVLAALGDAASRFAIPLAAFGELIDGCEADVRETTYRTFGELEHYCRCVAGSIGRLSLGVFGSADPQQAQRLADSLGIALQLTNILRDIREDLGNGRVYLPAEDLAKFGCTLAPGDELRPDAGLERLVRYEADRAERWYATGLRLLPMLDWRSAASAGAMAGIYHRLLRNIAADPAAALRCRMSLPASQKALVAARSLTGLSRRKASSGQAPGINRPAGGEAGRQARSVAPGSGAENGAENKEEQ